MNNVMCFLQKMNILKNLVGRLMSYDTCQFVLPVRVFVWPPWLVCSLLVSLFLRCVALNPGILAT